MPAVDDHGDVDVDDVTLLQAVVAGNAMAEDMVDRGADRLGKAAVVQGRRNGAVPDDEVMAQTIQLARGDARLDVGRDEIERLGGQASGPPHGVEGLGPMDLDAAGVVTPILGRFGVLHQMLHGAADPLGKWSKAASNKWLCRGVFKPY